MWMEPVGDGGMEQLVLQTVGVLMGSMGVVMIKKLVQIFVMIGNGWEGSSFEMEVFGMMLAGMDLSEKLLAGVALFEMKLFLFQMILFSDCWDDGWLWDD